jgi:hypothetical protein
VQLVDPPHDRQIGRRYRLGAVMDTAPAELKHFRLPISATSFMAAIDHRFAVSISALLSASVKKIILQRQQRNLGVQRLQIHRRCSFRAPSEYPGRLLQKLRLSTRDLVRVSIELSDTAPSVLSPLMPLKPSSP